MYLFTVYRKKRRLFEVTFSSSNEKLHLKRRKVLESERETNKKCLLVDSFRLKNKSANSMDEDENKRWQKIAQINRKLVRQINPTGSTFSGEQ